jgi:hypothetical protein
MARAEVLDASVPERVRAGAEAPVALTLRNPTSRRWYDQGGGAVRTGYRWLRQGDPYSEGRGRLQRPVAPGGKTRVWLRVPVPDEPGVYTLEAGLLWEHVRWFARPDGTPLLSRQVTILGPSKP